MIDIVNGLIKAIAVVLMALMSYLPASPLSGQTLGSFSDYAGYAAYFLPLHEGVVVMQAVVAAVALYYAYRWVLRLMQYIT